MQEKTTMSDYASELENSFQPVREGDILDVTVVGVSDTEVTVDLAYYTEGVIPLEECSDDPSFSIKRDVTIGDTVSAMVLDPENADGNVLLSRKRANRIQVWDTLEEAMTQGTVFSVKITEAVPAGVTGYVHGIRGFIPVSQLTLTYVEDTSAYVGMTLPAVIITAERDTQHLVLSAKRIAQEQAIAEQTQRIGRLSVGDIVEGPVSRMESYGVFIDIGEGLTGLCHISQITSKFLKSPKEVLKLGQTVKARILKIEGDRISLSIKALREDTPNAAKDTFEIPAQYSAEADSSDDVSPFAKLLQDIRL